MPLVNVMVNGRAFTIACDEGEEDHLRDLAGHIDAKMRELLGSVGQVGDQRLLLMAALLITDEYFEAAQRLEAHRKEAGDLAGAREALGHQLAKSEDAVVSALEAGAKRVEDIVANLARA